METWRRELPREPVRTRRRRSLSCWRRSPRASREPGRPGSTWLLCSFLTVRLARTCTSGGAGGKSEMWDFSNFPVHLVGKSPAVLHTALALREDRLPPADLCLAGLPSKCATFSAGNRSFAEKDAQPVWKLLFTVNQNSFVPHVCSRTAGTRRGSFTRGSLRPSGPALGPPWGCQPAWLEGWVGGEAFDFHSWTRVSESSLPSLPASELSVGQRLRRPPAGAVRLLTHVFTVALESRDRNVWV